MTAALFIDGGRAHVRQPRSDAKKRTRCGANLNVLARAGAIIVEVDSDDVPPTNRCRKCFPGTGRPAR